MIKRLFWSLLLLMLVSGYALFCEETIEPVAHPRFSKITGQGKLINPWQGPWACVFDRKLNVLWEVKTDSESIHDANWTYSWFNHHQGKENFGDCYFEPERCDTQDLIRRTQQEQLCGQSNWRLPTSHELESLLQEPSRPGQPHIAYDYFPHIKKGDYWSNDAELPLSNQFKHLKRGAKAVNFQTGDSVNLPYRNAAFVILVSPLTQTQTQLSRRANSTQ